MTMIYNELSIWIINNPIDKPIINQFKNEYQKIFYREYNNLYIIDNILYRITNDKKVYKSLQNK